MASCVFSQRCTINEFLEPFCLLYVYQPEKVQASSLKPSSCCLRQSQTVDFTLNGVSEHMQGREKEHDRWTYESTAGLWQIVMKEATEGDPKIHTPSPVSVQPNQRLRFQRKGNESKCFYVYACLGMCMHYSTSAVHAYVLGVKWSDQNQVALHSHLLSLVFGSADPEYCKIPPVSECCGQVS